MGHDAGELDNTLRLPEKSDLHPPGPVRHVYLQRLPRIWLDRACRKSSKYTTYAAAQVTLRTLKVLEFNKELAKKDAPLQHLWAVVATLGHWMLGPDICQTMLQVDDGERIVTLISVFGCLLLTALDAVDRAGKLKSDSEFRDLGLVMSIYLEWSDGLDAYGVDELEWRE